MASKIPMWGNESTFNLETILQNNILSCHYFKELYRLKTYHEVMHEIVSEVRTLEPWASKNPKTPSTAFCLLYKFFTQRLTEKQMVGLIDHKGSQFVRAIGFLYLRYTCPPNDLWSWFGDYLEDESEISPKGDKGSSQTFGSFLVGLLTDIKYFDTTLPRIPVPVQREINQNMSNLNIKSGGKTQNQGRSRSRSPRRSASPRRRSPPRRDDRRRSPSPRRDDRNRGYDRRDDRRRDDRRDDRYRRSRSRSPRRDDRRRSPSPRRRSPPRRDERRRSPSPRRYDRRRSRSPYDRRDERDEKRRRQSRSPSPQKREPSPKKEEEPSAPPMPRVDMSLLKSMYGAHTTASFNDDDQSRSSGYEKETIRIGGGRRN